MSSLSTLDTVSFISLPLDLLVDFGAAAPAPRCRHLLPSSPPRVQGCSETSVLVVSAPLGGSARPVWWEGKWPGRQEQWALFWPVQLQ